MIFSNKKAAMFGVEAGALRKQSGGLFLAKLRRLSFRLVEGQQLSGSKSGASLKRFSYNAKTAAMFGVDARIALLIFAIITVVVSANIYRILSEINIGKVLAEANTIGSAVEQYHKTMKKSIFDTLDDALSADDKEKAAYVALYSNANLKVPYNSSWNGPYLKVHNLNNMENFLESSYRLVRLAKDTSTTCNNTKANPCYVFLKFKDIRTEDCQAFEDETAVNKYTKVHQIAGTPCSVLINIALDY